MAKNKKVCKKCKLFKLLHEFSKHKGMSDGYENICKECRNIAFKKYYNNNSCYMLGRSRNYRQNHKDEIKRYMEKYRKSHKEQIKKRHNENRQDKLKTDILFRMGENIRSRVRLALKNNQKSGSAIKDLGCSMGDLKLYLEVKFYPNAKTNENMTWDNYGFYGWHIDHIVPLSSFDLTNREQFLKACHYTNLQPLWAKENIIKRNKIINNEI